MSNLHKGHRLRMRERCKKDGAGTFEDHELIEILLYNCVKMGNTNENAHKLLNEFGSIENLFEANPDELEVRCGVSSIVSVLFAIVAEINKRCKKSKMVVKPLIDSSSKAGEFAIALLRYEINECFYVICLDTQNRVINHSLISKGSINETVVYPRDIVEIVIRYNTMNVILAHNHPGGIVKPTMSDISTTNEIIKVLNMINVRVIDHIIVAENEFFSFADKGLIKNDIN